MHTDSGGADAFFSQDAFLALFLAHPSPAPQLQGHGFLPCVWTSTEKVSLRESWRVFAALGVGQGYMPNAQY